MTESMTARLFSPGSNMAESRILLNFTLEPKMTESMTPPILLLN